MLEFSYLTMTKLRINDLPEKYRKLIEDKVAPKNLSKYRAKRVEVDGYKFDSQKEAKRYVELKLLKVVGDVSFFVRQPMLDIGAGTVYKADFLVFWSDGHYSVEDVKGFKTDMFKLKKKLVESKFPFKIELL